MCTDLGVVKLCASVIALRPAIWDGDKDDMLPLLPELTKLRLAHPDCLCDHTVLLKTAQFLSMRNNNLSRVV